MRHSVLRHTCALFLSIVPLFASAVALALPSFPGAEGFGAGATGGRGGRVIKVTTLAATGPGSLQAALDASGPRIIVFAVSGVINGDIEINRGDVTIAGQTAPGAGITIAGRLIGAYSTSVGNMILRHLRIRPPPKPAGMDGNQHDGIQLSRNSRLILDHVTVSWAVDENLDVYEASDVTIQWCAIEEAARGGHPDGSNHNYGMINGPDGRRVSIHHNLFAHNANRNPAVSRGPIEVRNNVVYDVRVGFTHHNPATGSFNVVGNFYRRGPSGTLAPFYLDDSPLAGLSYYFRDNYIDDPGDLVGSVDNPWQTPLQHDSFANLGKPSSYRSTSEHDFAGGAYVSVTTERSTDAYSSVMARAGAFPRDVVTSRIVREVEARTGNWDAHRPANLLEGLSPGAPSPDGDGDGIADDWERGRGLDPADGSDATRVLGSGYAAIEEYINGLADQLVSGTTPPPPPPRDAGTPDTAVPPPPPDAGAPDTQAPPPPPPPPPPARDAGAPDTQTPPPPPPPAPDAGARDLPNAPAPDARPIPPTPLMPDALPPAATPDASVRGTSPIDPPPTPGGQGGTGGTSGATGGVTGGVGGMGGMGGAGVTADAGARRDGPPKIGRPDTVGGGCQTSGPGRNGAGVLLVAAVVLLGWRRRRASADSHPRV